MKGVAVIPVALIFLSLVCEAQLQTSLGDTLIINEVVVRGKPFLRSAGFARNRVDSLALSDYFGWSVSDVLRSSSTLFMKTYGAGGIATISLRGGGASHTVVTWNGINLNSPVLGQSDLSLIPSVAADEITVHNGGSSLPTAQGGLGGVVEIETLPDWNSGPFSTETAVSAGSYGRFSVSSVSRYGGKSWRFASRFNFGKADNDFEYINKWLTGEPSKEKRANATFRNRTYLQEAWNRSKNSVTGARIWLQETNRMIPVPVNVSPSSHREQLESRIVNGILTHDLYFGSDNSFSSSAVIQSEQMIYTDEVTGLVSDYGYKRMILNALLLISNGDRSALRTGVSAGTAMAESDNYTDITIRNNISFSVSGEHRAASFADLNFNSSLNFVDGGFIFPDISAGAEIIPVPRKNLAIRANVAVKSRVPTLNDLHWIPGGNPGLTPERARNAELAATFVSDISSSVKFTIDGLLFMNNIRDMIAWMPGEGSLWSPVNIGHVKTPGAETSLKLVKKTSGGNLHFRTTYSFSRSVDMKTGNILVYTPLHSGLAELRAQRKRVGAGTSFRYTGIRYVSADNSSYMPAYMVTDVWAGICAEDAGLPFEISLKLENAFNVTYQTMAYHPMPPASLLLNVKINTSGRAGR